MAIAVALAVAYLLKRLFDRRARRLAAAVMRGELSPEMDTRLRLVQRLVYAIVTLVGIAVALSKFEQVEAVGRALLTSSAIAAAVVGFAARQTLANIVAGIMLAITQPLRVGDWIQLEDDYGVVEDVTLNFTILRTGADQRIVIPNEKLASSVLRNDTLHSPLIGLDVSLWIPPEADAERAVSALQQETGSGVSIVETVPWGTRLAVGAEPVAPPDRYSREAELRARCLRRLRAEGLLPG